ncbi:MAG: succinate--CoA ligase subunit alpha [Anaerolineaceae bacterium]|nr:succinate--CoA ligase subunit alpha [Anaerolineaceae bacterium]
MSGVTPGKGGSLMAGIPVFDTVAEAKEKTDANVTVIFVPAMQAPAAMGEAIENCMQMVVCITEHIPVLDMVQITEQLKHSQTRLLGPNCPGIISPGQTKIGIMPGFIHKPGNVGVISRSGALTYEIVKALTERGFGQSTVVGIGGDPVHGTSFQDCFEAFEQDPQTEIILMIGEIGGEEEENTAGWIQNHITKPVIGFIAGQTAPAGKRMGHAGAVISGGKGTAASKFKTLEDHGILTSREIASIPSLVQKFIRPAF